ncbi:MAG TPA: DUF1059 domain-containing protein [Solirubrobacteraceae bacterium]|jgi:hypothetical protein|nr:DUF1059 domain-containing protein [Solirubrobacteraceae bacterium]
MSRKIVDCRRFENEAGCSLTLIGEESELIDAAVQHAVAVHGHEDTPATRQAVIGLLEPEESYVPGARAPEPYPA